MAKDSQLLLVRKKYYSLPTVEFLIFSLDQDISYKSWPKVKCLSHRRNWRQC